MCVAVLCVCMYSSPQSGKNGIADSLEVNLKIDQSIKLGMCRWVIINVVWGIFGYHLFGVCEWKPVSWAEDRVQMLQQKEPYSAIKLPMLLGNDFHMHKGQSLFFMAKGEATQRYSS